MKLAISKKIVIRSFTKGKRMRKKNSKKTNPKTQDLKAVYHRL